ncbi:MAG: hypothetical protein RBR86_01365 [Pseudobdellovibrionaceae bacterium]|jgi:hypothetical protein|nr:hypothetical protein [Pseudobdellovibrionaceae bacterium]
MKDADYIGLSEERIRLGGESSQTGIVGLFVAATIGVAIAAHGIDDAPSANVHATQAAAKVEAPKPVR